MNSAPCWVERPRPTQTPPTMHETTRAQESSRTNTPKAQRGAATVAQAMPGVGSRGIVATGRNALHCLLALCGLMAARSPCAADTSAAPPAATAAAALYSVREGDLFGLIDAKGRVVLPPEFSESKQRTHRVFNATGRDITPPKIDLVGIPADGMVRDGRSASRAS